MKFGKSIRAEARNNRGLSFVNFKYLKRIIKRWAAAANVGSWDVAKEEDKQFHTVFESELERVAESFEKELKQILLLQTLIQRTLPSLDVQPNPEVYAGMGFEGLQLHLQSLGGLNDSVMMTKAPDQVASTVKTSAALCDFCVNLGKISARCKRLRRCVLWNAVAIVKILKKRQKNVHPSLADKAVAVPLESAAHVLSRQDWYCSPELERIVSIVDTTTDTLMQRLTDQPPSREQYQCPICFDVVLDPVSLRTCGHRFCWACLCMAYCEKPEGALERCPCCRAAFPLDPEAFVVDGILSRFLKTFFPEVQSTRLQEQRENLRHRLEQLQRRKVSETSNALEFQSKCSDNSLGSAPCDSSRSLQEENGLSRIAKQLLPSTATESTETFVYCTGIKDDSPRFLVESSQCCPDCPAPSAMDAKLIADGYAEKEVPEPLASQRYCCSSWLLNSAALKQRASQYLSDSTEDTSDWAVLEDTASQHPVRGISLTNGVAVDNERPMCRHQLNVKRGKPADVERFAFTNASLASSFSPTHAHVAGSPKTVLENNTKRLPCFASLTASVSNDGLSQPGLESFADQVVSFLLSDYESRCGNPLPSSQHHNDASDSASPTLSKEFDQQDTRWAPIPREIPFFKADDARLVNASSALDDDSVLPPITSYALPQWDSYLGTNSMPRHLDAYALSGAHEPIQNYNEENVPQKQTHNSDDNVTLPLTWKGASSFIEEAVDEEDDFIEEEFLKLQLRRKSINSTRQGVSSIFQQTTTHCVTTN